MVRCSAKAVAVSAFCAFMALAIYFGERRPDPPVEHAVGHVISVSEGTTDDGDHCYYSLIGFVANRDYVTFEDYCTSERSPEGQAYDVSYDPESPSSTAAVDRTIVCWIVPAVLGLIALGALAVAFLFPSTGSPLPGARTASRTDRPD